MVALQLGPLAFPLGPLLWLGALLLALASASRLAGPQARAAADTVWLAALLGFAVARLVFVAGAASAYAASPWNVLDIRDGGWSAWAGAAAAAAMLAWRGWRCAALRRALGLAAAAAALFWALSSTLLGLHERPPLPALLLEAPGGARAELRSLLGGGPAVVNLWATWCAPCRTELPAFAAAQQQHPRVRFVFVNQGEDAATVQRFLAAQPFALDHVWLDHGARLGPAIGSTGLPTTLFIDGDGRIVERRFGMVSAASLAARLRSL